MEKTPVISKFTLLSFRMTSEKCLPRFWLSLKLFEIIMDQAKSLTASQEEQFFQLSNHLNLDSQTRTQALKMFNEFCSKRLNPPSR